MNTFVKKLLEFADFCGKIENFDATAKSFGMVDGVLRDGTHRFSITVRFDEIKEEQNGD